MLLVGVVLSNNMLFIDVEVVKFILLLLLLNGDNVKFDINVWVCVLLFKIMWGWVDRG